MQTNCPEWSSPEPPDKLHHVVVGLDDFHRFTEKKSSTYILQHGDLKTWHGRIFCATVPLPYYAGNYRSDNPSTPCLRENVGVDGRRGALFADVPKLMQEFSNEMVKVVSQVDQYLHQNPTPVEHGRAVLQMIAFLMGRLLQIHPFLNGNGRMARCLANYYLRRYGYPYLFSPPLKRPIDGYAAASAECMIGNFVPMYKYLLQTLALKSV